MKNTIRTLLFLFFCGNLGSVQATTSRFDAIKKYWATETASMLKHTALTRKYALPLAAVGALVGNKYSGVSLSLWAQLAGTSLVGAAYAEAGIRYLANNGLTLKTLWHGPQPRFSSCQV